MSIKKTALIGIPILGLLVVLLLPGNDKQERVYVVEPSELVLKVDAGGTLESTDSVVIKPPRIQNTWRYTISFMAPEGQDVTEETVVLRFDAQQIAKRLEVKKSQLASNQKRLEIVRLEENEKLELAQLELAEREADFSKAKRKADTPSELMAGVDLKKARYDAELSEIKVNTARRKLGVQKENMAARIRGLESSISSLQRSVKRLQEDIAKMTVKAPQAGLLVHRTKWNGDKYTQGETAWLNSNLMEIPNLEKMVVKGVINEPDAGKIAIGMEVDIRLDANPDRLFKGKITSLGKVFRRKSRKTPIIVFDATISIENPDSDLMRPGMAARLEILTERKPDVLQIPEDAIAYDNDGPYVRLKGGMKGKKRIQLGRRVDNKIVVLDGLQQGDQVILGQKKSGGGEA